jgi:hypothetical protein
MTAAWRSSPSSAYPRGQVRDLRLKLCHLLPQRGLLRRLGTQPRDLRIPLRQQLLQPGVGSTQPGSISSHTGRIGHTPHSTTAGPL